MPRRQKMSRRRSRKVFRRASGRHRKNNLPTSRHPMVMRGGIRL